MTDTSWLYLAAALSFFTCAVHIFGGGRSAAAPLLASTLPDEPKLTNYYCWHMVTIVIGFQGICYVLAASGAGSVDLAAGATVLALLFAAWSIFLTVWKRQRVLTLPQWMLFLPIFITGALGLI